MKKRKIFLIFPVLLILILIFKSNIFSVGKVEIVSNAECTSEEELKKDLNSLNINWTDLKTERIKKTLKEKYLCIKDINLSYQFPETMKIMVYGRRPLVKVMSYSQTPDILDHEASISSEAALLDWSFPSESSDNALIADDTGYIFTKKPVSISLPVLFLPENLSLGKQLDAKKFNNITQIFSKIPELDEGARERFFKAKIYDKALLIESSFKIAFSLEKDVLRQLGSLQLILQKAKIDQRATEIIDLRFDKPFVEYQPKLSR